MSMGQAAYVLGALFAVMGIGSLPMFGSLRGAGKQYRATILRQLGLWWVVALKGISWLTLGWFAIEAGGRWFGIHRDFTLVLMGVFFPLLFIGIRAGNRSVAAAQHADRGLLA